MEEIIKQYIIRILELEKIKLECINLGNYKNTIEGAVEYDLCKKSIEEVKKWQR